MASKGGRGDPIDGQLSFDALLWGPAPAVGGAQDEPLRAASPSPLAKWRPNELSQIPNPEEFFSQFGEKVETQIEDLAAAMAGDDPGGEDYLQKLGRLRMARFTAEGQILRELVLLPAEPGHPEYDPDEETQTDPEPEWLPMVMSPDHPNYHDEDDNPSLPQNRAQYDSSQPL